MSIQESIQIQDLGGGIARVVFDLVGEKVNKLSSPIMVRFKEVLQQLQNSSYKVVILSSKKKDIFIAGADIEEIKKFSKKEDYDRVLVEAHSIFNLLEDLKIPTIAEIKGACLGGGCELVLACDYRLASSDKKTKIGLPEVQLGIIPGFGGCVRLPRVIGLPQSLDIILAGKAVDAVKAFKLGLVDEAVPAELLSERVLRLAQEIASGKKGKRQKKYQPRSFMDRMLVGPLQSVVFSKAKKTVLSQSKGFYPAPLAALDVIQRTYGFKDRTKALQIEKEKFCEVAITDISKNLIEVFYLVEGVKKNRGIGGACASSQSSIPTREVQHMAVLGAGVMGGGIAQVAADKGVFVRMKDITTDALALGYKQAASIWKKQLQRKKITQNEFDQKMSALSGGLDYSGFRRMDVVVEAIVEDLKIKKAVIKEAANHSHPDTIMATNTSSLSVNAMAEAHPKPENFLGMHFFNPVDKMPLVEIIRGDKTSDEATVTLFELAKKMGKIPIVVKDAPGFLVNRLLVPYMGEAIFMLEQGMAVDVVDRYYTHQFGMPMGPFRLLDEVGLDVGIKVLKIFKESLGDRIGVSELAHKILPTGRLGKKNGKGFYLYDSKGKETGVDSSLYGELGLGHPTNPLSEKECLERGIFAMVNEATLALVSEKIVDSAGEVDLGMIMGTGFPPFRGGLLRYADRVGIKAIVEELEIYSSKYGKRFKPSQPLIQMANQQKTFY